MESVLQQLTARYGEMMKNPREWTPDCFSATERDIGSAKFFASDLRGKLLDFPTLMQGSVLRTTGNLRVSNGVLYPS